MYTARDRLRAPMAHRLSRVVLASLLVAALGLAGCGEMEADEPVREGLDVRVDGVDFNVGITRQLNLKDAEDRAYYRGAEPPPGSALYGVFLEACNRTDEPQQAAEHFKIVDTRGNEFEPRELPDDNIFAYQPRTLAPEDCIPEAGSIAASGPTQGALLLFQLPLESTENRPLELEIEGADADEPGRIDLDI
jgi:hypothetical protein